MLQPLAGIGQEVGEEHVGLAHELVAAPRAPPGMLEREADAALAPVGVLHERLERARGRAAGADVQAALGVAGDGVLDLDDVGAPVGEHRAGRGREGELRHLDDLHALHGLMCHTDSLFVADAAAVLLPDSNRQRS